MRLGFEPKFHGEMVWLTPEQGGRAAGPPEPSSEHDYASVAFVPPATANNGLASFVVRAAGPGWRSEASGDWLVVPNEGLHHVVAGTVLVVAEGVRVVGYFHVRQVDVA